MERYKAPDGKVYEYNGSVKDFGTNKSMVLVVYWGDNPSDYCEYVVNKETFDTWEPIITLGTITDYGDHMSKDDFLDACESGCLINDDGFGNLATKDSESNFEISPSNRLDVFAKHPWATHVVWYNR